MSTKSIIMSARLSTGHATSSINMLVPTSRAAPTIGIRPLRMSQNACTQGGNPGSSLHRTTYKGATHAQHFTELHTRGQPRVTTAQNYIQGGNPGSALHRTTYKGATQGHHFTKLHTRGTENLHNPGSIFHIAHTQGNPGPTSHKAYMPSIHTTLERTLPGNNSDLASHQCNVANSFFGARLET
jgi:hypothetical protein